MSRRVVMALGVSAMLAACLDFRGQRQADAQVVPACVICPCKNVSYYQFWTGANNDGWSVQCGPKSVPVGVTNIRSKAKQNDGGLVFQQKCNYVYWPQVGRICAPANPADLNTNIEVIPLAQGNIQPPLLSWSLCVKS
jgi:hypothetical protein